MQRALLALGIFPAMTPLVSAADLAGQPSIIDGDTLEIHGTRVRLWGIDAPESDQLCRNEIGEHFPQTALKPSEHFIQLRIG